MTPFAQWPFFLVSTQQHKKPKFELNSWPNTFSQTKLNHKDISLSETGRARFLVSKVVYVVTFVIFSATSKITSDKGNHLVAHVEGY